MGIVEMRIVGMGLIVSELSSKCGQRRWSQPPLSGQWVVVYRSDESSLGVELPYSRPTK